MKRTVRLAAAAATAMCLGAGAAQAAPLFFAFDVDFTSGTFAGTGVTGTFSIEDSTFDRSGEEFFRPNGVSDGDTLLSFDIEAGGVAFQITNELGYPNFPIVVFVDGVVDSLEYFGGASLMNFFMTQSLGVFYGPGIDGSEFTVSNIRELPASVVPLPAGAVLLLTGLGALALARRRAA